MIDSSWFEVDAANLSALNAHLPLPIGRPFAGTFLYVCDEQANLLPAGVPGELCIGGRGVAEGYHNNAPLTAAGQGTAPAAFEAQAGPFDAVLVAVGGGGLIAGVSASV